MENKLFELAARRRSVRRYTVEHINDTVIDILPHWNTFLSTVQKYYNALTAKSAAPKAETSGRTHTVRHGDTLWKIAEQYLGKGGRYPEIVKLNGLKSNVLKSGQVLRIPEK